MYQARLSDPQPLKEGQHKEDAQRGFRGRAQPGEGLHPKDPSCAPKQTQRELWLCVQLF